MSIWIKRLLALVFINFMVSANAEDVTALVKSSQSFHLTPEEKALFVEASDRFKKYEIPKKIDIRYVYWLDNERLAFSSRKYPGWEAEPNEMSRVITYNVNTGEIIDSGYRGVLKCLNHVGDMLLAQSEKESDGGTTLKEYRWFNGKWGQSLEPIEYPAYSYITNHLCSLVPEGDPIFAIPPEKQPPGFANVMPLLPEHGALETTVIRNNQGQIEDQLHLIKPDGKHLLIGNRRLNKFYFTYLPWNETYLETVVTPRITRLISPSGEVSSPIVPVLLRVWGMTIGGYATSYVTRVGMLWGVQLWGRYWRKQGIFLQTNEGLLRIEVGQHEGPIKISPNGCMVHAQVVRGDSYRAAPRSQIRVVINVCKEIEQ
jgi:hypothetical protein